VRQHRSTGARRTCEAATMLLPIPSECATWSVISPPRQRKLRGPFSSTSCCCQLQLGEQAQRRARSEQARACVPTRRPSGKLIGFECTQPPKRDDASSSVIELPVGRPARARKYASDRPDMPPPNTPMRAMTQPPHQADRDGDERETRENCCVVKRAPALPST